MKRIVAVEDAKAGATVRLWESVSVGSAEREFEEMIRKEPMIQRHAEDFSLWCLGRYDEVTKAIEPEVKLVMTADEVVRLINEGGE